MHIAQVAPLFESVPPKGYGGTERVVSYLTEELVRRGHEVTLFASGDSNTSARLIPCSPRSLRDDPAVHDSLAHHLVMVEAVARARARFDVIHFHCAYLHFPLSRAFGLRQLTTLHGRLDRPEVELVHRAFPEMPLISISDSQRVPIPDVRWISTVHHGLPPGLYSLDEDPGDYLAFLGRISPEKGLDRAIQIAGAAGMKLKVAAKLEKTDPQDVAYFRSIQPLMKLPHVEFVGEIGEADKGRFLGKAKALLFPIDWPEPFGMVLIESLACGTPVIAFDRGSVPEIIDHGETGFLVNDIPEAIAAVGWLDMISRSRCREIFERRFTAARMADDYLDAYVRVLTDLDRSAHQSWG